MVFLFDALDNYSMVESLLSIQLIKYNKSNELTQDNNSKSSGRDLGLDYSVKLHMGQVQVAVLGKFFWEITVSADLKQ